MAARMPAGAGSEPGGERFPAGSPEAEEALLETPAKGGIPQEPAEVEEKQVEKDFGELLAQLRQERDEYLELAQRTQADFENYRRRVARESQESERRGTARLAAELIPVLDNLERALAAAGIDPARVESESESESEIESEAVDGGLAKGILLTYRDLAATLSRAGVEAYHPAGEKFDPNWHEALTTRAEDGTEGGIILEVVEKGYRLDGQVLRAARVVVSA